jgi:transcriptional regulator with XRE-family HTH domain
LSSETIGQRLKALRVEKKKTISEVAEALNISPSALYMYERDQRTPRDNIKIALADYYRKPIGKIFFVRGTHDT